VKRSPILLLALVLILAAALPVMAQGTGPTVTATVVFDAIQLREAPDLAAPAIGQAARDEVLTLTGRTADSTWYQTALDDGTPVWLAAYVVHLDGDGASLPVIEAAAAQTDTIFVPPGCDYFNIGPFHARVGQRVILTQGWAAASEALVQDYLNGVLQIVSFDGRLISTYAAYASDVFYDEASGTYQVFWSFDMGPIAAGVHTTEWTQIFDGPISDGLDANNDGQPDTYGPDPVTYTCTIIIE
jgi:hypothetical protein